ncbi:MAG TPA: TetR/AcrR family transcriptional regulator [Solirubrobacteraceae bacterium]|nr:TetR/AcrR family transcriptional regulator [Solirubrobacteraceae bacterium]
MSAVGYRPARSSGPGRAPVADAGAPPRRAPGRPRADESVDEEAFLEAALRAFAVYGYDAVSVRTLNRQLGVSHSWVHQRFGSKANLWYAAVDRGFGRQAATIAFDPTVSDPLEHLERGIRGFLRYSADHRELGLIMNAEGAQDTERLDYIYEHYIAPPLAPYERLLTHLIDEGRVRPVSMRTLFLLIAHGGAAPFGLLPLARRLGASDPNSKKNVEEHIEAVTRILIEGIRLDR